VLLEKERLGDLQVLFSYLYFITILRIYLKLFFLDSQV
jgi:hypothetical protein